MMISRSFCGRSIFLLLILLIAVALGADAAVAAPRDVFVDLLGAGIFYDNGFDGDGVILGVVDRGRIDARGPGLNRPGKVTAFLRWQGLPDSGLDVPTGHETAVANAAAAERHDDRRGVAPGAEIWSVAVFTHDRAPWITSANPPFYGLLKAGRLGVRGRTAHVLNNSWNWNHDSTWAFDGATHVTLCADAVACSGVTMVVAANNFARQPEPPADGWNVITVGASGPGPDVYDRVADFSNRGPSPTFFDRSAGDTRCTIDIVAPGVNTPWGGGTSLAAPYVSGAACLLIDKGLARGYSTDPRVIKAVLLNAAEPLAGWTNHARWKGGTWSTPQPLDYAQGAGRLSMAAAYHQYDAPAQRGEVGPVGWDLATVSETTPIDYRFRVSLRGGARFVATLVWFMERDVLGYDPRLPDPFGASTLEDQSFDNLDLELWALDASGTPAALVAESVSTVDSVEHLRLDVPRTATYRLRVRWTGEVYDPIADANEEVFAVAWKTAFAGDLDGDGEVDGEDVTLFAETLLGLHEAREELADFDGDGCVSRGDIAYFPSLPTTHGAVSPPSREESVAPSPDNRL